MRDVRTSLVDERLDLLLCLPRVQYAGRGSRSGREPVALVESLKRDEVLGEPGRFIPLVLHRERDDRVPSRLEDAIELEEIALGPTLDEVVLVRGENLHASPRLPSRTLELVIGPPKCQAP